MSDESHGTFTVLILLHIYVMIRRKTKPRSVTRSVSFSLESRTWIFGLPLYRNMAVNLNLKLIELMLTLAVVMGNRLMEVTMSLRRLCMPSVPFPEDVGDIAYV